MWGRPREEVVVGGRNGEGGGVGPTGGDGWVAIA